MSKEETWNKYKETKELQYKQALIEDYIHLVKIVAGRLYNHQGGKCDFEDLTGYGIFGLIDAIEKFDPERNIKFETYAQIRIRGAIIDHLRKLDWVPRSLRKKSKEFEEAIMKIEAGLARSANNQDIAIALDISEEEVENTLSEIAIFNVVSLEEQLNIRGDIDFGDGVHQGPDDLFQVKEIKIILKTILEELPEKEKKVISLYYYNELTYKEIGKVLNLSESRISQLHSKAILTIKSKMEKVGINNY